MVVKMMKWSWPPLVSWKYEVKLIMRRLEGCDLVQDCAGKGSCEVCKLTMEIRWKALKLTLSSTQRMAVARNFTKEVEVHPVNHNGDVEWDEEFQTLCNLSAYKDNVFHPWEIASMVFNGLNQRPKNKVPVVGTSSLNLAEYASAADKKINQIKHPTLTRWFMADRKRQLLTFRPKFHGSVT